MSAPIAPTPIAADRQESWLRRLFSAKGPSLAGIAKEVQLSVDAVGGRYEDQLLAQNVMSWWAAVSTIAVVGSRPCYGLFNLPGSGVLVTVDQFLVELTTGATFSPLTFIARVTAANPTGGQQGGTVRDLRGFLGGGAPGFLRVPVILGSEVLAAGVLAGWAASIAFNQPLETPSPTAAVAGTRYQSTFRAPWVLPPGTALLWDGNAAGSNTASNCWVSGTVRAALPIELAQNWTL